MAEIDIDGGVPATTLNGSITSGSSSITVTSGTGYPSGAGGNFYIVVDLGESAEETIECSATSGNVLTVATRGADGSSAAAHNDAATVAHVCPALTLQEANSHANATTGTPHGSTYLTTSTHASVSHTAAMIGAGEVGESELASDAVTNAKIGALAVDTAELAADAVDGTKIADDAVDSEHIAADSIDAEHYAAGSVDNTAAGFTWTTFAPTWTQSATISHTATYAKYCQIGKIITVQVKLTATSAGTTSNVILLASLPTAASADGMTGAWSYFDTGTAWNAGACYGSTTSSVSFIVHGAGNSFGGASEITVASGDVLNVSLTYEAA